MKREKKHDLKAKIQNETKTNKNETQAASRMQTNERGRQPRTKTKNEMWLVATNAKTKMRFMITK